MNKRLILAAFAALALLAGSAAMADSASPPGLMVVTTAAKNVYMADLLAVTLPDKRSGKTAIARFEEPRYSSVVGSNTDADSMTNASMGEKLVGVNRVGPVRIAGHFTSSFSPGIGAGSGDHAVPADILTIGIGGGSGNGVAAYSIAGIKGS